MFKTSNPALRAEYFSGRGEFAAVNNDTMTIKGAATKTAILLGVVFIAGMYTWDMVASGATQKAMTLAMIGGIGAFITAIITIFAKQHAMVTAPIYAALEGLLLGAISSIYHIQYRGIVLQAIVLTLGVMAVMLAAYRTGIIRPTQRFVAGVVSATGAIFLCYLASMIFGIFGINLPFLHSNGIFGILISVAIVTVAALNLILDFAVIEEGQYNGAPKYMEWYGAFSLMVTLIWLYIEILRLLAKLNDRR